jgi:hypothetical protein
LPAALCSEVDKNPHLWVQPKYLQPFSAVVVYIIPVLFVKICPYILTKKISESEKYLKLWNSSPFSLQMTRTGFMEMTGMFHSSTIFN